MPPPGPSDAALLGDRATPAETFAVFYRRQVPGVLAFCARQGLSPHDAADATSDVFVVALTQRYRFDPTRGESAAPWLLAIATNVMAGTHRRTARERAARERLTADPAPGVEPDVAESTDAREEVERALAAISELPIQERSAIVGRFVNDAQYDVLAQQAGVSEQAVRQRVSRALSSVRERLDHER